MHQVRLRSVLQLRARLQSPPLPPHVRLQTLLQPLLPQVRPQPLQPLLPPLLHQVWQQVLAAAAPLHRGWRGCRDVPPWESGLAMPGVSGSSPIGGPAANVK